MTIDFSFDAGAAGLLDAAELDVGVFTPSGLFWLDPVQGFVPTLARVYSGTLPTFGPATLASLPDVAALSPGAYLWLILVDEQIDGLPSGDISDFVLTTIR